MVDDPVAYTERIKKFDFSKLTAGRQRIILENMECIEAPPIIPSTSDSSGSSRTSDDFEMLAEEPEAPKHTKEAKKKRKVASPIDTSTPRSQRKSTEDERKRFKS